MSALSSSGDTFLAIKQTIQAQANCGTQVMITEMTKDLCTPKSLPSLSTDRHPTSTLTTTAGGQEEGSDNRTPAGNMMKHSLHVCLVVCACTRCPSGPGAASHSRVTDKVTA